jgi:hypothetical protein
MQAVTALTGDGGVIPPDFLFYDVCAAWSCTPSQARKESAFDFERQAKKILIERSAARELENRRIEAENARNKAFGG